MPELSQHSQGPRGHTRQHMQNAKVWAHMGPVRGLPLDLR